MSCKRLQTIINVTQNPPTHLFLRTPLGNGDSYIVTYGNLRMFYLRFNKPRKITGKLEHNQMRRGIHLFVKNSYRHATKSQLSQYFELCF